jgi:preprotein translocase subunit SecA
VSALATLFSPTRSAGATQSRHRGAVAEIRRLAESHSAASDTRLAELTRALRQEVRAGAAAEKSAPATISLVVEAIRRVHGLTPYDVQLIAGLALADGQIAEMATGEGKTLVALLPAACFALHGRGAHVATVNPYLAERDCEFATAVFARLGLSVGLLKEKAEKPDKRAAYACDITYGVGTEFGFDYLRDQLSLRSSGGGRAPRFHELLLGTAAPQADIVQRGHAFAVVDEADSILIDEARSPLIISAGERRPCAAPQPYLLADRLARSLQRGSDFVEENGRLSLTLDGRKRASADLTDDVLGHLQRLWPQYVEQALHARHQLRLDVHYIVADGKCVIVDEFTGRPCPDRTWRDGLHQAVEAAAGVEISEENLSEATITRPAYFKLYERVCGMSGTAAEAASELRGSYGLGVSVIPLHRPNRRALLPDRIFQTRTAKLGAVVEDVARRRAQGQPVLVGTRTVANSEELASLLTACRFPFRLLNAKQDDAEAEIVAQAGEPGTVTIATNMAGRGAHIPLPAESERAGGLHVIGLERHESARIDRQLIGRAARQGQPGSAQFFLSLEDELLARHAPEIAAKLRRLAATPDGELPATTAAHFLRTQRKVEAADREARRALAEYDRWLDELKQAL